MKPERIFVLVKARAVVVVEHICIVISRGDISIIAITSKTFFDIISQRQFYGNVKNLRRSV